MPDRWLLDVNVPTQLVLTLKGFGVEAETAASFGWKQLTNGHLVEAANRAGYFGDPNARSRFSAISFGNAEAISGAGVSGSGLAASSCVRFSARF